MVSPMAIMPCVRMFWIRQAAVKAATATEPNMLMAACITIVPDAVTENCNAIGTPIRS